jgi:hypothetical protein
VWNKRVSSSNFWLLIVRSLLFVTSCWKGWGFLVGRSWVPLRAPLVCTFRSCARLSVEHGPGACAEGSTFTESPGAIRLCLGSVAHTAMLREFGACPRWGLVEERSPRRAPTRARLPLERGNGNALLGPEVPVLRLPSIRPRRQLRIRRAAHCSSESHGSPVSDVGGVGPGGPKNILKSMI